MNLCDLKYNVRTKVEENRICTVQGKIKSEVETVQCFKIKTFAMLSSLV